MKSWKSLTDDELIEGLNVSDQNAFTEIFNRYHGQLYSFAVRKCDAEAAEELVQDLFTALWVGRQRLTIRTTLRAYLYVAMRNLILNQIQKGLLQKKVIDILRSEVRIFEGAPEEALTAKEISQAVERQLLLLPEKCRAVYQLSRKQFKSNKEIASEMGIAEKTVENHMTRALHFLRLSLHHFLFISVSLAFFGGVFNF